jgi:hypothetical protein
MPAAKRAFPRFSLPAAGACEEIVAQHESNMQQVMEGSLKVFGDDFYANIKTALPQVDEGAIAQEAADGQRTYDAYHQRHNTSDQLTSEPSTSARSDDPMQASLHAVAGHPQTTKSALPEVSQNGKSGHPQTNSALSRSRSTGSFTAARSTDNRKPLNRSASARKTIAHTKNKDESVAIAAIRQSYLKEIHALEKKHQAQMEAIRTKLELSNNYVKALERRVGQVKKERDLWIDSFRQEADNRYTIFNLTDRNRYVVTKHDGLACLLAVLCCDGGLSFFRSHPSYHSTSMSCVVSSRR